MELQTFVLGKGRRLEIVNGIEHDGSSQQEDERCEGHRGRQVPRRLEARFLRSARSAPDRCSAGHREAV